jgi:hypothetical protein
MMTFTHRLCRTWVLAGAMAILFTVSGMAGAQVTVVNMTPNVLSGEKNQDSEANLAVNPENTALLAASAFTPDPAGGPNAPIYISTDGGSTWTLNSIVPSAAMTADITLRFGSKNRLYGGIIPQPITSADDTHLNILRTNDATGTELMERLVDRTGVDQPYIHVLTVGDKDRVLVGDNDTGFGPKSASVDKIDDAAATSTTLTSSTDRIESRDTGGQDGPPIRLAISSDGKVVYSAHQSWIDFDQVNSVLTLDVVVKRDDNGGFPASGSDAFGALLDPGDHRPGVRVVSNVKAPWDTPRLGQERVGADLAIAVDPNDSRIVYVAWSDQPGTEYTLHLRRSQDSGQTWSNDLRTVPNAKNPGIAINNAGKVGFLYQQVITNGLGLNWLTRFERSTDAFATPTTLDLSNTPANNPTAQGLPYLGDYLSVTAAGKDFYGVFTASNLPDKANFPSGVVFQRNADFGHKLLLDIDNTTRVPVSIDPFFFKVKE